MAPQEKSKYGQLFDKVNELAKQGAKNELSLAQIEREAKALKKVDLPRAFSVLGAVACLKGSLEDSRRYHEQSICLSNNDPEMVFNYSTSLGRLGRFSEAMHYAQAAYDKSHNPDFLEHMIVSAIYLGLNTRAKSLIEEWESLTNRQHEKKNLLDRDNSVVREEVEEMLQKDLDEYKDLWEELADT